MRGQAVRAETEATVQAVDVFLVLSRLFMNYAGVVEFLCEKHFKPAR